MRSTIHLCKFFGIPVGINASWFLVIFLITFLLQSQFHLEFPLWSTGQTWILAGITGLFFFGSVLAHELAHSVVATFRGIPVYGITLFVFGGISNMAQEERYPWVEFVIAIAGPLLSIILGGVLIGVAYFTFSWSNPVSIVALTVGWANLALGIFNLMPGFPLDGGRVLLAIIWGFTGDYRLAMRIVTRTGQGLAILFIAGSVVWFLNSGEVAHLWMLLIGLFLFFAATSARVDIEHH